MEKRRHERIALDAFGWQAELIDQMSGEPLGEVVNLSASGLMIITREPVQVDGLYQVECVSKGPGGEHSSFTAGVLVLWVSPASQADTQWAGLQIIDIGLESRKALVTLREQMVDR